MSCLDFVVYTDIIDNCNSSDYYMLHEDSDFSALFLIASLATMTLQLAGSLSILLVSGLEPHIEPSSIFESLFAAERVWIIFVL